MQKTAINQAIEYVRNIRGSSKITDPSEFGRWVAMEHLLTELLPTEQQQIEEAYDEGRADGENGTLHFSYFDKTYATGEAQSNDTDTNKR